MKKQFGEAFFNYGWLITAAIGLVWGYVASERDDFRILLAYMVAALLMVMNKQSAKVIVPIMVSLIIGGVIISSSNPQTKFIDAVLLAGFMFGWFARAWIDQD